MYKVFGILLVFAMIFIIIARAVGAFDMNSDHVYEELMRPLELKNWHYALLVFLLVLKN